MERLRMLITAAALSLLGNSGSTELASSGTLIVEGRIVSSGLEGDWRLISDLGDGRFATRTDLSEFKMAEVYDGRDDWRIERSGGSHKLDSPFARRRVLTAAWLGRMGWLQRNFGGAARSVGGVREDTGLQYEVVTATPPGGRAGRALVRCRDGGSSEIDRAELVLQAQHTLLRI